MLASHGGMVLAGDLDGPFQLRPLRTLFTPQQTAHQGSKMALGDDVATLLRWRQKEDFLLDVGGQVPQVEDLREPGAADTSQLCQFSLIGHAALAEQTVQVNGQGHQPSDAGNASWERRR